MNRAALVGFAAVVVTVIAVPLCALAQMPPVPFAEGQPFPMIGLPDLDGTQRTIADYRGQKVVLHVFASW